MVIVLARSRAGFFPIRTAFPGFATGRRPHCSFRGLLGFHTHYGPPDCSPTLCGLCREVPISPVTRTHRSPAIESNHQLFEWVPPPLVISPFGAHAKPPAPPDLPSQFEAQKNGAWRRVAGIRAGLLETHPSIHLERLRHYRHGVSEQLAIPRAAGLGDHPIQEGSA